MGQKLRLLVIEDSEDDCELLLIELKRGGLEVEHSRVCAARDLRDALEQKDWDIAISDYNMPGFSGLEAMEIVKSVKSDLPFILISGSLGEERAVAALKAGAQDYIVKGNLARLVPAVRRELSDAENRKTMARALRESEDRLRQAQKMEAVGQLAGGVAHDFNNVLAAIMLYAEAIAGRVSPESETFSDAEQIRKASERAAALTRQLLAFGRKQVFQPQVMKTGPAVDDLAKMLRRLIGEHILLETSYDAAAKPIRTDPRQFEQILLNLAVNARDAMPDGGKLTIAVRKASGQDIKAVGAGPGEYVALDVTDSGCGMDKATQERIFEPFFTTKGMQGTGLGLATVYGIVQRSGGFIHVESEPGKGTRFSLLFPACEGQGCGPEIEPAPLQATERSETILLVEDDDIVRGALRTTLAKMGFSILEAREGKQAVLEAEKQAGPIELAILDISLPGGSGLELAKILGQSRPAMKLLFISGYGKDSSLLRALEEEHLRFMPKPFTSEQLLRKVQEVLDGR